MVPARARATIPATSARRRSISAGPGAAVAPVIARAVLPVSSGFVASWLAGDEVPDLVRGAALSLTLAGLLSIAFMGFAGLGG